MNNNIYCIFIGEKGSGKSTALKLIKDILIKNKIVVSSVHLFNTKGIVLPKYSEHVLEIDTTKLVKNKNKTS